MNVRERKKKIEREKAKEWDERDRSLERKRKKESTVKVAFRGKREKEEWMLHE